ncbi:MAG: SRPBCC family protein [Acidobacteria bacterium]|nr:SRPBCC family protein [Acidobacteriota bacterium]
MPVRSAVNSHTFEATTPSDREIVLTRLFDAPRRLVFDAMTKPEHVRRWWGALDEEHSVTVCEIDLRPGGAWRFVGRGPEGEFPAFYGTYREIAPPERVVFTEVFEPYPDVESVVTSVFTEEGAKTRLTVTCLYPSLDVRDMVLETGMTTGAGTSYDRLEDLVGELQRS